MQVFDKNNQGYKQIRSERLDDNWSALQAAKQALQDREGQLAKEQKQFVSNQTKFKLVVYYSHKKDGTPYSVYEKQRCFNRKYINSYDYTTHQYNYNVTDYSLALRKLIDKMVADRANIDKAFIIMNDWKEGKEYTIGKFPGGIFDGGDFVHPIFTYPNEKGHVYVQGLPREALKVDMMRVQNFAYKKLNNR